MITCSELNDALETVMICDNRENPDSPMLCGYSRTFGTDYSVSSTASMGVSETVSYTIQVSRHTD